jgi:hypothetical protein
MHLLVEYIDRAGPGLGKPAGSLQVMQRGEHRVHQPSNIANPIPRTVGDARDRVIFDLNGAGVSLLADARQLDYSYYLDIALETLSAHRVVGALICLHGTLDTKPATKTQIVLPPYNCAT